MTFNRIPSAALSRLSSADEAKSSAAPTRRQWLVNTVLPLAAGVALSAWPGARAVAGYKFFLGTYDMSRDELQALVTKQLPLKAGLEGVLSIRLQQPQVSLDPAGNRVHLDLGVAVQSAFTQPSQFNGNTQVSTQLAWDAPARTLRLRQPQLERISLDGLSERDAAQIRLSASALISQGLDGLPIKTFTKEEMTFGNKTIQVGEIKVLADKIEIAVS